MPKIIVNDKKDWLALKEKHRTVKKAYMSKALSFQLNTPLALSIRKDALAMKSSELISYNN